MTIDRPTRWDLPAMKRLWLRTFQDTEDFWNAFRRSALSAERCLCLKDRGRVLGALYWFDCSCRGRKLAYLYAFAVAEGCRGQGLGTQLLERAHELLRREGYEGVLLVPGGPELRPWYSRLGYRPCCPLHSFLCGAGPEAATLYRVDAREYGRLRRELLPEGGVVQEEENLDFLAAVSELYAGPGFLLAARREGEMLFGLELLGDSTAAPAILETLGLSRGTFRTPGQGEGFAMYLPFCAAEPPSYFALAFD